MLELRRLVRRYINGNIPYSEFRREFVTKFLAVSGGDVDSAVAEIECLCIDVAERLLSSEAELKGQLAQIVRPQEAGSSRAGVAIVLLDSDQYAEKATLPRGVSGTPRTEAVFSELSVSASGFPEVVVNKLQLTT